MEAPATIEIAALRREVNRLLDLFESSGHPAVEIDNDLYWAILWGEERVGAEAVPPAPSIGSLADDVDFLHQSAADDPVPLMLCHVAPVLHYLGQRADTLGVY